jgi:hypothetical protein
MTDTQPSKQPPSILYKYLPPERIDVLENLQIRFSSPSDFNDTFDSHYLVQSRGGFAAVAARLRFKRKLGVFCLTEKPNNHLMWVNYAKNHTGFILGFEANVPFFQGSGRTLRKVVYQERPGVYSDAGLDPCFYKSTTWAYEEEWRCAGEFKTIPNESRLITIEPKLIAEIILGAQMEPWHIGRIVQLATALDIADSARFSLSTAVPKSWSFENRRHWVALCNKCEGNGYHIADSKLVDPDGE